MYGVSEKVGSGLMKTLTMTGPSACCARTVLKNLMRRGDPAVAAVKKTRDQQSPRMASARRYLTAPPSERMFIALPPPRAHAAAPPYPPRVRKLLLSLALSLSRSLACSLPRSLARSPAPSLASSLARSRAGSLPRSLARSSSRFLAPSLALVRALSLALPLALPLAPSLPRSLARSLARAALSHRVPCVALDLASAVGERAELLDVLLRRAAHGHGRRPRGNVPHEGERRSERGERGEEERGGERRAPRLGCPRPYARVLESYRARC